MSGSCSTVAPDGEHTCRGFVTDLLVRCGQGDDASLAALFDLFHPLVGALAVTHAPDLEVTEVVLAAFTRVWRGAATFRPEEQNAVSWVLTELASSVAAHAAGASRRPTAGPRGLKHVAAAHADGAPAPTGQIIAPV